MFSAIIHKKGIHNAFNEDALTSLVFDALKLLPYELLKEFIEGAKNLDSKKLSVPEQPFEKLDFWPGFANQEDWKGSSCCPDLVISWKDFLIVEESKWESPKSGEGTEEDEEKEIVLNDQLSRELLVAQRQAKEMANPERFALLYITNDLSLPQESISKSLSSLKDINKELPKDHIYWTNWHNLTEILLKNGSEIADNLYQALGVLGINLPFTGFGFLQELSEDEKPDREILKQNFVFYQYQPTSFNGFDFLESSKGFSVPDGTPFIFYQGGGK